MCPILNLPARLALDTDEDMGDVASSAIHIVGKGEYDDNGDEEEDVFRSFLDDLWHRATVVCRFPTLWEPRPVICVTQRDIVWPSNQSLHKKRV